VLLGLREASWLDEELARAKLTVISKRSTRAYHSKAKTKQDPLHSTRAKEVTTLYTLEVSRDGEG
jgi:hypothetical protein